jgi:hypothetical protein
MDAPSERGERGLRLLATHLASLEVDRADAHGRLAEALGAEFARKLVFALCGGARGVPASRRVAA